MIEVILGDIFKQDVDAIVNPANSYMLHGGGLAALIARNAGPKLRRECNRQIPVKTGEAIITTAGNLPFKAVIHAVGPVWEAGDNNPRWRKNSPDEDPDELLRKAHVNAVFLATLHGIHSLAFPAVSCGVFHFPVERAAPIAIEAVSEAMAFCPSVKKVVFCLMEDSHYDAFTKAKLTLED